MRQKPNIKTKVVHSRTKDAWNVVGTSLGEKYKIARIPYTFMSENCITSVRNKAEALEHAMFISYCFNYPEKVTY